MTTHLPTVIHYDRIVTDSDDIDNQTDLIAFESKSTLVINYGKQQVQNTNTTQRSNSNNSQNSNMETPTIVPKFIPQEIAHPTDKHSTKVQSRKTPS